MQVTGQLELNEEEKIVERWILSGMVHVREEGKCLQEQNEVKQKCE
jgi:hypothetical protein